MEEQPCPLEEPQHRNLDIVGLHSSSNGHSCSVHSFSDLMGLVKCVVTMHGKLQDAIKCVRIIDGTDSCCAA
jgi:hypothetical protein